MVKLNKNRSENFLAFVSTRARSGSRPMYMTTNKHNRIIAWSDKIRLKSSKNLYFHVGHLLELGEFLNFVLRIYQLNEI